MMLLLGPLSLLRLMPMVFTSPPQHPRRRTYRRQVRKFPPQKQVLPQSYYLWGLMRLASSLGTRMALLLQIIMPLEMTDGYRQFKLRGAPPVLISKTWMSWEPNSRGSVQEDSLNGVSLETSFKSSVRSAPGTWSSAAAWIGSGQGKISRGNFGAIA